MIALLYQPIPGTNTGPILGVLKGSRSRIEKPGRYYVEVFEDRDDWSTSWTIVDGVPVYTPPTNEEINAAALKKLRYIRDSLLKHNIDSMNPMRWAELSSIEKSQVELYRRELLDWPQQETDILNPTQPNIPSVLT